MKNNFRTTSKKISAVAVAFIFSIYLVFAPIASAYELVITGNGDNSDSQVTVEVQNETTVVQENEGDIVNDITTKAETGNNEASGNSGDVLVTTGNTDETILVANNLNNNTAVVGDCCETGTAAKIKDNGSNSNNKISIDSNTNTNVQVSQTANVTNEINGYANTGSNKAVGNNGDVSIKTGDIKAEIAVDNNTNFSNVKVSSGEGIIKALIAGNGFASVNTLYANYVNAKNVNTKNIADIGNFFYWFLNSGGNNANSNNGKVKIATGDVLFDLLIANNTNFSNAIVDCCVVDDPNDPSDPEDPGDPGDPNDPGVKPKDKDDDPQGLLLPAAASTEFIPLGGPMIMGLSDTSSRAARTLFFWIGLGMMVLGAKVIGQELLSDTSFNKSNKRN